MNSKTIILGLGIIMLFSFACIQEPIDENDLLIEDDIISDDLDDDTLPEPTTPTDCVFCTENQECIGETMILDSGEICCIGECIEALPEFPEFPEE